MRSSVYWVGRLEVGLNWACQSNAIALAARSTFHHFTRGVLQLDLAPF